MVKQKAHKGAAAKRKAKECENTNSNSTKLIEATEPKRSRSTSNKAVATKMNKSCNEESNPKIKGGQRMRKGRLTPRRLDLNDLDKDWDSKVELCIPGHSKSVQTGQAEKRQLRAIVTEVDSNSRVQESKIRKVNQGKEIVREDYEDVMPQDGVMVDVPDSEDDFKDSEYESEDDEETEIDNNMSTRNQQDQAINQLQEEDEEIENNEDSDPEITLSTKKKFLRKELERDPRLKEVFQEMVRDEISIQTERMGRQEKLNGRNMNGKEKTEQSDDRFGNNNQMKNLVAQKSPSDSTLYMPALVEVGERNMANNIIDNISNFVESIRMESSELETPKNRSMPRSRTPSVASTAGRSTPRCELEIRPESSGQGKHQQVKNDRGAITKADKFVLDVEKLKVNLIAPQGMLPIKIDQNIELL